MKSARNVRMSHLMRTLDAFEQAKVRFIAQKREEIVALAQLALCNDTRYSLEIGAERGGTSLLFALLFDRHVAVDVAPAFTPEELARDNIVVVTGESTDPAVISRVGQLGKRGLYDLIFIDGDHTYEGVKADFIAYTKLLRPGGIIALHDIVDSQVHRDRQCDVARFWREIKHHGPHLELITEPDDYMGIGMMWYLPKDWGYRHSLDRVVRS